MIENRAIGELLQALQSGTRVTDELCAHDSAIGGLARRTFNYAVLAYALDAARQIGLLDCVAEHGWVDVDAFSAQPNVHTESSVIANLAGILACADVLSFNRGADRYHSGPEFAGVYRDRGYLFWLLRACGETVQRWPDLAKKGGTEAARLSRRGLATAQSSALIGQYHVDQDFYPLLRELTFSTVCDLGCGGAARLMRIVSETPGVQALGVDVNPQAVRMAQQAIAERGLSDWITIVQGDVTALDPAAGLGRNIDLLTMSFMGHDLWPRAQAADVFGGLRRVFPRCTRFLLADTVRGEAVPFDELPVFQIGFESVHALMRQYIPTESEWRALFVTTGWHLNRVVPLGVPNSVVFDLTPQASDR